MSKQAVEGARVATGLPPLDRVLGGGIGTSAVVLLAGPAGCGKTQLTLQALAGLGQRCLYVTSEDTCEQIVATARRVGALSKQLYVLSEQDLTAVFAQARKLRPQVLAIDTLQLMRHEDVDVRACSPTQLKACRAQLVHFAKAHDMATWIVGVVGSKTIEHDVDVVLKLEKGAKLEGRERILRCPDKNRFGSTSVAGHFELTSRGFVPLSATAGT